MSATENNRLLPCCKRSWLEVVDSINLKDRWDLVVRCRSCKSEFRLVNVKFAFDGDLSVIGSSEKFEIVEPKVKRG